MQTNIELFTALRDVLEAGLTHAQLVQIATQASLVPITGMAPAQTDASMLASTLAFAILPPPTSLSTSTSTSRTTFVPAQPQALVRPPAPPAPTSNFSATTSQPKLFPPSEQKKRVGPSREFRQRHLPVHAPVAEPAPSSSQTQIFFPVETESTATLPLIDLGDYGDDDGGDDGGDEAWKTHAGRLPPYNASFTDAQKAAYFLPDTPLSDKNKKYCRAVRHVAAQQDAWCLEDVNQRQYNTNPATGKKCSNPYPIATKSVGRDGAVGCFPHMDWTRIPAAEVQAEIHLKKKKGVDSYAALLALQARERLEFSRTASSAAGTSKASKTSRVAKASKV